LNKEKVIARKVEENEVQKTVRYQGKRPEVGLKQCFNRHNLSIERLVASFGAVVLSSEKGTEKGPFPFTSLF